MDLLEYLRRQKAWSLETFGPGNRTAGILDHLRKELIEIAKSSRDVYEWIDVVILAFDGAWREGFSLTEIVAALQAKQATNKARDWPDWRGVSKGVAIEHVRDGRTQGDRNEDAWLREFASWMIDRGFAAMSVDAAEIQQRAIECGLIEQVEGGFDKDRHTDLSGAAEPGDEFWVKTFLEYRDEEVFVSAPVPLPSKENDGE
jgi:hypothetical protein